MEFVRCIRHVMLVHVRALHNLNKLVILTLSCISMYRGPLYREEINSLPILLSRTQAGPGRAVKEQQEQNSPNHVQRINLICVQGYHGGFALTYVDMKLRVAF